VAGELEGFGAGRLVGAGLQSPLCVSYARADRLLRTAVARPSPHEAAALVARYDRSVELCKSRGDWGMMSDFLDLQARLSLALLAGEAESVTAALAAFHDTGDTREFDMAVRSLAWAARWCSAAEWAALMDRWDAARDQLAGDWDVAWQLLWLGQFDHALSIAAHAARGAAG
jgi:hypothetical protein